MNDFDAWDAPTRDLLEQAYVEAGDDHGVRARDKRRSATGAPSVAVPMDRDGTWLDFGCANGFLMATLPSSPPSRTRCHRTG